MTSPTDVKPGLVLGRRVGDVIVVELPEALGGQHLTIAVTQIDRNQVKLGINCPREWVISRGEILETYPAPEHVVHHTPGKGGGTGRIDCRVKCTVTRHLCRTNGITSIYSIDKN